MKDDFLKELTFTPIQNICEHIPLIATWHQDEWHQVSPDHTVETRIKLYSSYKSGTTIPSCIVALHNNMPIGTASLIESDMDTMITTEPWLASVYVTNNYRQRGVASQLIQHCIAQARQAHLKKLYLYTPHSVEFYQKRGWCLIQNTMYNDENVDIMSIDL